MDRTARIRESDCCRCDSEGGSRFAQQTGVEVGTPPGYDMEKDVPTPPQGTAFTISVEWKDGDKTKKVRAEELVFNVKTQKPLQQVAWIYTGSRIVPDLDSEDEDAMMPQAFMSNDLVALRLFDASALFQNPLPESSEENIYKKNDALCQSLEHLSRLRLRSTRRCNCTC